MNQRINDSAWLALGCISTLVLFPAFELSIHNAQFLTYGFIPTASYIIYRTCIYFCVLFAFLEVSKIYKNSFFITLFISITVFVYVERILPFKYEIFSGKTDKLGESFYGYIDTAVFVVLVVAAFLFRKRLKEHAVLFCKVLISIQALAIFFSGVQSYWKLTSAGHTEINSAELFNFSKQQKNIVVLIIDSTQSDATLDALLTDPALQKIYSGFTFFMDTVSPYNSTHLSIPSMIGGARYDHKKTLRKYYEQAFLGPNSIVNRAQESGYDSSLYSMTDFFITRKLPTWSSFVDVFTNGPAMLGVDKNIFDIVLFDILPYYFKEDVVGEQIMQQYSQYDTAGRLINTKTFVRQNVLFTDIFLKNFHISAQQPTFHVYHVFGAHMPFIKLQPKCEYSENNYGAFVAYSKIALSELAPILDQLEKAGIYKSTAIYIMGDHATPFGKTDSLPAPHLMPLFAVKPSGVSTGLNISQCPVATLHFFNYVQYEMAQTAATNQVPCLMEEPTRFTGSFNSFQLLQNIDKEHGVPVIEYALTGNARQSSSWRVAPNGEKFQEKLDLDTPLTHQDLAHASNMAGPLEGWSIPDPTGGQWTIGGHARLRLFLGSKAQQSAVPLRMVFHGKTLLPSSSPLRLHISDGTATVARTFDQSTSIVLSMESLRNGVADLTFTIDNPWIKENPYGVEDRHLGFLLEEVSLEPLKQPVTNSLSFVDGGNGQDYLDGPILYPQAKGTWSSGDISIHMPLNATNRQFTTLRIGADILANERVPREVSVLINGTQVASWKYEKNADQLPPIQLPAEALQGASLDIYLRTNEPFTLQQLGIEDNATPKTIFLRDIELY